MPFHVDSEVGRLRAALAEMVAVFKPGCPADFKDGNAALRMSQNILDNC